MSDRTQASVRAGSPSGAAAAPTSSDPAESTPASSSTSTAAGGGKRGQSADSAPGKRSGAPGERAASGPAGTGTPAGKAGTVAAEKPAGSAGDTAVVDPAAGQHPAGAQPATEKAGGMSAAGEKLAGARAAAEKLGARMRGPGAVGGRGPRRARLQLRHIDTWSALKISLVLSIALFFIWMVAVGVLYGVLSGLGVFETLNDLFGQVGSASGAETTGDVITPGVVFGGAAVIGAINIVLLTALCTVGTFIYNLCSDLVGGLEVTLSERD